jgi:hypothetical protein
MVVLTKLSEEQTAKVFPKRGQMDLTEYIDALAELEVGDAVSVELNGMTPRALKRRLSAAATARDATLKWAKADGEARVLSFQLRELHVRQPRQRRSVGAR